MGVARIFSVGIAGAILALVVSATVVPAAAGSIVVDAGRGGVTVNVPASYSPLVPAPLVVALHGYTSSGAVLDSYIQLTSLSEQYGFLSVTPDGTIDAIGSPFWNATDACCDLFNSGVDDSAYLIELVRQIRLQLNVDPWRVWFAGHSNGGFMSYRMACDHADVLAAVASVAGATFDDPLDCAPVTPVHVLQVHGTNDSTIQYGGGSIAGSTYPGATETFATWAGYDGCNASVDSLPPFDLEPNLAGEETSIRRRVSGCAATGSAELWTIVGGSHVPALTAEFRQRFIEFLFAHPKAGFVFEDSTTMSWPPIRWAETWRVYRGDLDDLFDGNGDGLPDGDYGACLGPPTTSTTYVDSDTPLPDRGYFYLAGFVDAEDEASLLGATSSGAPRLPAVVCP